MTSSIEEAADFNNVDVAVIKSIWPYLRPSQSIPADEELRSHKLVTELRNELCAAIEKNEATLALCSAEGEH